jgi:hypothetical protein
VNIINNTYISIELSRPDQHPLMDNQNIEDSKIIYIYEKNGFLTFQGKDDLGIKQ